MNSMRVNAAIIFLSIMVFAPSLCAQNAAQPVGVDTGFNKAFLLPTGSEPESPKAPEAEPQPQPEVAADPLVPATLTAPPVEAETLSPNTYSPMNVQTLNRAQKENPVLGVANIPADPTASNKPKIVDVTFTGGLVEACNHVIFAEQGKPYDGVSYGICFGYFRGVKNSYDMKMRFSEKGSICFPEKVTWIALINRFQEWARRSPGMEKSLSWVGLVNAFGESYPCRGKGLSLK